MHISLWYHGNTMWEGAVTYSRKRLLITLALLLAAVSCLGIWYFIAKQQQSPFPTSIQDTKLTLFYPTTLPEGFAVDKSTIKRTNGVITYAATNAEKHYINFSLQERADKFDFDTFYSTILTRSFKFVTLNGEAAVGTMQSNGNSVGSLINSNTWVIVSSTAKVSTEEVQQIISNLKPY